MKLSPGFFASSFSFFIATSALGAVVNFDTVGDLANNFNVVAAPTTSTNGLSESLTGGVLGSPGSVAYSQIASNDVTATYKQQAFNFTLDGTVLNETILFHLGTTQPTAATRIVQLGFLTNSGSNFNANNNQAVAAAFASVRLNTVANSLTNYTIELQEKIVGVGGTAATTANNTALTLTAGNWYRLSISLTNGAGAGAYTIGATVEDFGADGVTPTGSPFVFSPPSRTLADIDTTLSGGFRVVGVNNTTNYDTYTVAPEPSTGLLLLSGLGVLIRRRRS